MSEPKTEPVNEQKSAQPEHSTGYTGTMYPWMTDPTKYRADHSARHVPPMMRRKAGGKAR